MVEKKDADVDEQEESFESYIQRPRVTCAEIAPEISRLNQMQKGRHKRLHVLSHMLKRARFHLVAEKMKYVSEEIFLPILYS